ncbi:MAG: hypothetical protein JSS66_04705 [Armatimonadetes bacterium]|nr:hypothetical protein [Armatimonadota bacterium]
MAKEVMKAERQLVREGMDAMKAKIVNQSDINRFAREALLPAGSVESGLWDSMERQILAQHPDWQRWATHNDLQTVLRQVHDALANHSFNPAQRKLYVEVDMPRKLGKMNLLVDLDAPLATPLEGHTSASDFIQHKIIQHQTPDTALAQSKFDMAARLKQSLPVMANPKASVSDKSKLLKTILLGGAVVGAGTVMGPALMGKQPSDNKTFSTTNPLSAGLDSSSIGQAATPESQYDESPTTEPGGQETPNSSGGAAAPSLFKPYEYKGIETKPSSSNDFWDPSYTPGSMQTDEMGYFRGSDCLDDNVRTAESAEAAAAQSSDADLAKHLSEQLYQATAVLGQYGMQDGHFQPENFVLAILAGSFGGQSYEQYASTHSPAEVRARMITFKEGLEKNADMLRRMSNDVELTYRELLKRRVGASADEVDNAAE